MKKTTIIDIFYFSRLFSPAQLTTEEMSGKASGLCHLGNPDMLDDVEVIIAGGP